MSTDRVLYEVPEDIIKRGQSMNATLKRNPHSAGTDERKPFKPSNPMKGGEGGYISNFIRLEPKEAAKIPQRIKGEKNERPNFKYFLLKQAFQKLPFETNSINNIAHEQHS